MLHYMHTERQNMMWRRIFVLVLMMGGFQGFSQSSDTTEFEILADDPILAALDSMAMSKIFQSSEFTADTA
ncbi:MAG TPA: hypothetical protein DCR04_10260, partial [Flavobacteriales bacterium]|nr:hypothetical protein [Flavobacteriales bacterium]